MKVWTLKLYYEHLKAYPWLSSFQLLTITWIMRPQLCGELLGPRKGRTRVIWARAWLGLAEKPPLAAGSTPWPGPGGFQGQGILCSSGRRVIIPWRIGERPGESLLNKKQNIGKKNNDSHLMAPSTTTSFRFTLKVLWSRTYSGSQKSVPCVRCLNQQMADSLNIDSQRCPCPKPKSLHSNRDFVAVVTDMNLEVGRII